MSAETTSRPPKWIKPQLTRLVDEAPAGRGWVHEIKYDGYRMHARIESGKAKRLTRPRLVLCLQTDGRCPSVPQGEVRLYRRRALRPQCRRRARILKRLAGVLESLAVQRMPLAEPPPRDSRFGSPLKLSKVHWVRRELVVEVTYLTWTEDNLLRQVSCQGQREARPVRQVVRAISDPPTRS